MPTNQLINLSKKMNVSKRKAEEAWKKAKKIVKKQYPHLVKDKDEFYKLVYAITKKILNSKKN